MIKIYVLRIMPIFKGICLTFFNILHILNFTPEIWLINLSCCPDAAINLGESSDLTQKVKCPFTMELESLNHFGLFRVEIQVAHWERAPRHRGGHFQRSLLHTHPLLGEKPLTTALVYFLGILCFHKQWKLSLPSHSSSQCTVF